MRYNIKGKEVLAGNCKYYLNDLAFKNFLYPGFAYGVGYLLENAVYIELRRFGFQVYVGTIRDKEVDFVAMKDDRIIYIQVAYMMETEETMEPAYRRQRQMCIRDSMRSMLFQWMKFNFLQEKVYVMYKHGIYQKY